MTEYIDEYGEVHQIDSTEYDRQQKRMSESDIKREQASIDSRFTALTSGYDDQAVAELKSIALGMLKETIRPVYAKMDPRKSHTLKRLIVEHLEAGR